MSANALAIVFAPCILRCPDTINPLQSVQDISKTTAYVMTFLWLSFALGDLLDKHGISLTELITNSLHCDPLSTPYRLCFKFSLCKTHSEHHSCSCTIYRCVEMIICEQMNKYKARLKDINTLEFAESKAKSRLTLIRRSMVSERETRQTTAA